MGPNTEDWWTLDTAHLSVSDVQVGCVMASTSCLVTAIEQTCNTWKGRLADLPVPRAQISSGRVDRWARQSSGCADGPVCRDQCAG